MEEKIPKGRIRRFLPYYKKYWGTMVMDLICAALTTVCELVLPMIVRHITDLATNSPALLTISFVLRCGIIYFILRIIDGAAYYYMASIGHVMGTKIETDMRRDMFDHMMKLPFSYYDNTKVGTLMSRITSDLFDVTEFAHHCPEEFFISTIKIVVSFILLYSMNAQLTLIIFAILPPMAVVLIILNRKVRTGFRESRRQIAEINSQVEDSLLGIRVVKSFANEEVEKEKFAKGNMGLLGIRKRVYHFMGSFHTATRMFDGIMYIVIVIIGAVFLGRGAISAADFVAYVMFVSTLLGSIRRIAEFAEQFQRGMTGIERFYEVMDIRPSIVDPTHPEELQNVRGDICLKGVDFRYTSENEEVLHKLDLEIKSGMNVALVGPSGGGKTTISALIPRFYEINEGSITIDGKDIRSLSLASLRNNIGMVQQDVYLFSGSVAENIAYGKPDATMDEIMEAARLAGAEEFIKTLPNGYDTYVGERGVKLSGGQKQRISIARVFLKNPPILILDEATSALDNESERLVQQSLSRLAKGRTTLVIAHRLTTIKNSDKIVVLNKDGIREEGTHAELMAKKGAYYELYNTYTEE